MGNHAAALDVTQEIQPQPFALGGPRDQTRHVRHGETRHRVIHHRQIRHQSSKGIVRDLRPGGTQRGHQRRLPRRRVPHQGHIRHGFQLQHHGDFFAGLSQQRKTRSFATLGRQAIVTQASHAAFRHDQFGPRSIQVPQETTVFGGYDGTLGYPHDEVLAAASVAIVAHPHGSVFGAQVGAVVQRQQGGFLGIDAQNHGSTVSPGTAIGPGQRLVFLAANRGTAVPAVARLGKDLYVIYETCHVCSSFFHLGTRHTRICARRPVRDSSSKNE